jgi:hypothetical protein
MATGVTLVTADGKGPIGPNNPLCVSSAGVSLVNTTSTNSSVGTTAATVNLQAPSFNLLITNTHASNILYVSFNGNAATTSSYGILKGATLGPLFFPNPVSTISLLGSGSSTTYNLLAY